MQLLFYIILLRLVISCSSPRHSSRRTCRSGRLQEFLLANIQFGGRIGHAEKKLNLTDLIIQTLEEMEKSGRPEASINISHMVPTYQSSGPRHKPNDLGSFFAQFEYAP
jgi:hypothetical protein